MFFRYTLDCFDADCDEEPVREAGIVIGSSYKEAIENLVHHYGDKCIERILCLTPFSPERIIRLSEDSLDEMEREIIW